MRVRECRVRMRDSARVHYSRKVRGRVEVYDR